MIARREQLVGSRVMKKTVANITLHRKCVNRSKERYVFSICIVVRCRTLTKLGA